VTAALLDAALAYAARGWPVVPCHSIRRGACSCGKADCCSPGKHPRTQNGLAEATSSAEQIRSWWGRWPDANIAVRCDSLFVLDVDPRHGGDVRLERLKGMPTTLRVRTGGGGWHLYMKGPGRNGWRKQIAAGLDVQAGPGKYVLAPPSNHASGKCYEVDVNADIADVPQWLTDMATRADDVPKPPQPPLDADIRITERARRYLEKFPPAISGQGGHACTLLAAGHLIKGFRLDNAAAFSLLSEWNLRCDPPWSERELRHKIREAPKVTAVEWGQHVDHGYAQSHRYEEPRHERVPGEDDEGLQPTPTPTPTPPGPQTRRARRAPELVYRILERANDPWVSLGLGGKEIASLRLGSVAMLMGGPGAGKSTLSAALVTEHARLHGPGIYLSLELDDDELGARIVGMQTGTSWADVLRGKVCEDDMAWALNIPRLAVLDGSTTTFADLEAEVMAMREEFPGQPIFVAVDYLQIVSSNAKEIRAQVGAVAESLRVLAKRLRVVALGVSQTSRSAGKALRAGELTGVESMTAGAESSAIERAAYLTLAIGSVGPIRDDQTATVELSIGKGRFGGGDRVLPMSYNGRTGKWEISGEARLAADVNAEKAAEKDDGRVETAKGALVRAADKSDRPQSRGELRTAVKMSREVVKRAIEELLEAGELVEYGRAARSRDPLIWTPKRREQRLAQGSHGGDR
jgi:Bifunctional DNA primase/polymerase, N-terminal/DnaB-like helicase C terminal domain